MIFWIIGAILIISIIVYGGTAQTDPRPWTQLTPSKETINETIDASPVETAESANALRLQL